MLEEVLKEINVNLGRIANIMEKEVEAPKTTTKRKSKKDTEEAKESVEPGIITAGKPIAQTIVPVNAAPETFAQEEIARAMSSAMDAGRSDLVFGILNTFNTNSLLGINPAQYGEVARMLREAGIKI